MNLYETVTNTIVESLNRGVVPWRKPWDTGASVPVNALSNRPYRGVNLFLLAMTPFTDHRWLTFHQVKERGGSIRKGEKSTIVIFWKMWEAKSAADEKGKQIPLLKYYRVFNASQCEGLNLSELERPESRSKPERIDVADSLIRTMPDPPRIDETGTAAWYRPGEDLVTVPPMERFTSPDSFYATLFHELGHATGHAKRLARQGVTESVLFGSGEYGREELIAELTSAFCCASCALDNSLTEDSASYIKGWLSVLKADSKALIIASAQAQRAADYILQCQN